MNKQRAARKFAAGVAALAVAGSACAADIALVNPGFEDLVLGDGTWVYYLSGWENSGDSGTFNPSAAALPGGQAPQGQNVAYSNTPAFWITQVLATPLLAGTSYTLGVDVIHRLDTGFPGYEVQLLAGSSVIAVDNSRLLPEAGQALRSTISYTAAANDPLAGQHLVVRFRSLGTQVDFDDVRLTATAVPEPACAGLLLAGLLGTAAWRRHRR
jgi:outer membrane lipoprotein-sorting protein